jgi:hypothetical protein
MAVETATARGLASHLLREKERWLVDGMGWNNLNLNTVFRLSALTFSAFIGCGKWLHRPVRSPLPVTDASHPAFNLNFLLIVLYITTE